MKKIAILTINDYNNYGNRLQNFATQQLLKSYGFEVETLVHKLDTKYLMRTNKFFQVSPVRKVLSFPKRVRGFILRKFMKSSKALLDIRIKEFKKFTLSNIKESTFGISELEIPNYLQNNYDYFVTGSDQVWNPYFRYCSEIDFLKFASSEKRIAMSASIGISKIPKELEGKYKDLLTGFKAISIREHKGAEIVKNLINEEPEVLIDPTLNISKDEWLEISKEHINKPSTPYLLIYFLGTIPDIYQKFIDKYANENNLEIVILANQNVETYYTAGPAEFIDYINSADAFFTDSYHGIIFSILMNTPFLIFDRIDNVAKMNSRMETLQRTLQLPRESFYSSTNTNPYLYSQDKLNAILKVEKDKVDKFIKKNIV